jgi:hypothetical protein
MSEFLPKNYKVPTSSQFMKLTDGDNKIRILANPVIGWVGWHKDENGKERPFRRAGVKKNIEDAEVLVDKFGKPKVNHFWAFPVWNYKDAQVQVLEVTQKGIQKEIENYYMIEEWGNPVNNYDIVIKKIKEGDRTKYTVAPLPHKANTEEINQAFADSKIDLSKLFDGKYPMASDEEVEDEFAIVDEENI